MSAAGGRGDGGDGIATVTIGGRAGANPVAHACACTRVWRGV